MKDLEELSAMEDLLSSSRKITRTETNYGFITVRFEAAELQQTRRAGTRRIEEFLEKVKAIDRAQMTWLTAQWVDRRKIARQPEAGAPPRLQNWIACGI